RPHRQGVPRSESEGDRRTDSPGDVDRALPVLHDNAHDARHQEVRNGACVMKNKPHDLPGEVSPKLATRAEAGEELHLTEAAVAALREQGFSRRQFLKGSGALVVAFSVAEFADTLGIAPEKMLAQGGNTPQALDSWIAV